MSYSLQEKKTKTKVMIQGKGWFDLVWTVYMEFKYAKT